MVENKILQSEMEKYLDKCIESIINQTYKELEIIIVNDGSTDKSLEMCEKYFRLDTRIKAIDKKNGGLSSARNVGLDYYSLFIERLTLTSI